MDQINVSVLIPFQGSWKMSPKLKFETKYSYT